MPAAPTDLLWPLAFFFIMACHGQFSGSAGACGSETSSRGPRQSPLLIKGGSGRAGRLGGGRAVPPTGQWAPSAGPIACGRLMGSAPESPAIALPSDLGEPLMSLKLSERSRPGVLQEYRRNSISKMRPRVGVPRRSRRAGFQALSGRGKINEEVAAAFHGVSGRGLPGCRGPPSLHGQGQGRKTWPGSGEVSVLARLGLWPFGGQCVALHPFFRTGGAPGRASGTWDPPQGCR